MPESLSSPNPRRVLAGRLNHAKRKDLTPAGRERLRQSALVNRPWLFSTGPRSPQGKARSAANGKFKQTGEQSGRKLNFMLAELSRLAGDMASQRRSLQARPDRHQQGEDNDDTENNQRSGTAAPRRAGGSRAARPGRADAVRRSSD